METKFQTSFIPKVSLAPTEGDALKKSVNFFSFIATLIFIISALSAGGAYVYLGYLKKSQETVKTNLEKNIKAFEPQTIETYVRLSSRLNAAHTLLSKHISLSNVFDYLSDATLKTVRFNDFKYQLEGNGNISLTMNGEARNYNAVAYQSQVFGQKRDLKNLIFSDLDLDEKGNVVFKLSSDIEPTFAYYVTTINKRTQNVFSQDINQDTSELNPGNSASTTQPSASLQQIKTPSGSNSQVPLTSSTPPPGNIPFGATHSPIPAPSK